MPAATERVDIAEFNSQDPMVPSRAYVEIGERSRMSNQRICLSSQAVMRSFALPPHMIDLIVDLCTLGAISKPGAVEFVALPFVLPKVGEVGEEESLCGEPDDWERS